MIKTLTRVLRMGSRGHDVGEIQATLNQLPSTQPLLATDGVFGSKTTGRVIEKVESDNPHTPSLETIDGNLLAGRIQRRKFHHRVGKDNFNYYSLR